MEAWCFNISEMDLAQYFKKSECNLSLRLRHFAHAFLWPRSNFFPLFERAVSMCYITCMYVCYMAHAQREALWKSSKQGVFHNFHEISNRYFPYINYFPMICLSLSSLMCCYLIHPLILLIGAHAHLSISRKREI